MEKKLPILIIADGSEKSDKSVKSAAVQCLIDEIHKGGRKTMLALNLTDGLMFVESYPDLGCILLEWDMPDKTSTTTRDDGAVAGEIIKSIRGKNRRIPIFLLCSKTIVSEFPIELMREVREYIYLYIDTPGFITSRIEVAIRCYYEELLPPFFRELKKFAEEAPYYWDCPGHMGGVAYLKHAIGAEFHKFFGENLMRSDVGCMEPPLGDYLAHKGVAGESEENAARIFGADQTFYVLGGSSASNQIVAQGSIKKNETVLVDRNCHKSLNHALTQSDARPLYLVPKRNGYGILGLISAEEFTKISIETVIEKHSATLPVSIIITNCTYDGLCYKVEPIVDDIGKAGIQQIHFDEAWFAHAKFNKIFDGRFAMGIKGAKADMPLLFAVQSTHKMLPALSLGSMIHVKKGGDDKLFEFDRFNQAFMMHGSTSPLYPLIASIDVATSMMDIPAGKTLLKEAIKDSIDFRQAIVTTGTKLQKKNKDDWFFKAFQPDKINNVGFGDIEPAELEKDASCWTLKPDEKWHGFSNNDVEDGKYLLDPTKVTILTPGIDAQSQFDDFGIPAKVVAQFLNSRKIYIAKTGDYTILVIFSVGNSKGKWGTLLEGLIGFKNLYDTGANVSEAIPDLAASHPRKYGVSNSYLPQDDELETTLEEMMKNGEKEAPPWTFKTLKELCYIMHKVMRKLDLPALLDKACNKIGYARLSPAEAYQRVIDKTGTQKMPVRDMLGQVAAFMVVPYPPGIPILMPGEVIEKEHIEFMKGMEVFGRIFPGFGSVPHGLEESPKGFVLRKVNMEDDEMTIGNGALSKYTPGDKISDVKMDKDKHPVNDDEQLKSTLSELQARFR